MKELKERAVIAMELAIKFHDVDERVQILEQVRWTYNESSPENLIEKFPPLSNESFWK